jgi:hypothetical protein
VLARPKVRIEQSLTLMLARSPFSATLSSLSVDSALSALPQSKPSQISARPAGALGRSTAACRTLCRQAAARQRKASSCTCRAGGVQQVQQRFRTNKGWGVYPRWPQCRITCRAWPAQGACARPCNRAQPSRYSRYKGTACMLAQPCCTYLAACANGPVHQQHSIVHHIIPQAQLALQAQKCHHQTRPSSSVSSPHRLHTEAAAVLKLFDCSKGVLAALVKLAFHHQICWNAAGDATRRRAHEAAQHLLHALG